MDPLHPARECRSLQTAPHPALQQTEISEFLRTKKPHRPRAGPRELPAARWYEVICSCLGCELSQVVNAESLFNLGDAIDNFEESIFTKEFVFLFLEIFAERIEFMCAHDSAKSRTQDGVLARFVRVIHADELAHRIDKLPSITSILERLACREMHRDVGQLSSGLMLLQKHIHKIDKFVRLLEAWEKKILFQLLVIIFNEVADD